MIARNLALALSVTLAGTQLELEIVPLRFSKPYFVRHKENRFPNSKGFHAFWGPFHLWSMGGLSDIFAATVSVQMNPFHGQDKFLPK